MEEPLTVFSECNAVPWTVLSSYAVSIATHEGHALYWEWNCEEKGAGPEDFLLFVRTIFPNGGGFLASHCNHSVLWSPIEDDSFAIGIRKLKVNNIWIVAVLALPETYPGSSQCPDTQLSMLACKFLAEEFMRGTDPIHIYNCEDYLFRESSKWWTYLKKLEKVVNWKLPEVKNYLQKHGQQAQHDEVSKLGKHLAIPKKRINQFGDNLGHHERRSQFSNERGWNTHNAIDYNTRRGVSTHRSRSPTKVVVLQPRKDEVGQFSKPYVDLPALVAQPTNVGKLRCNRCDLEFDQTYELMKHYSSDQHSANVTKEYPI